MKRLFYLFGLMLIISGLRAQNVNDPWWLSMELTNNKLDFRFYEGIYDFGQLDNSGFRLGVERYLNSSFDVEAGFSFGKLIYENIFSSNIADLDLRLTYKFDNGYLLKRDSRVAPYLFLGYGFSWFNKNSGRIPYTEYEDGSHAHLPIGGGLKFKVGDNSEINARAAYRRSTVDAPNYMQYAIGVSFSLSKKKDSDGDGIYDKEDACPNTAGPAENRGCPWPDTDGDGVLDKDDQCPTEAGTLNGCPDSDNDGIKDSEDACPNAAGPAGNNGCPDTDGDGLLDKDDQCPNQAGPSGNNGCPWPDADGDGVPDKDDNCPNVAGDRNGCPDSDGDGILDKDDNCPRTAGLAANNGCPKVKEEVKEVLALAVKNIQFNSGSDVLRASSYSSLDQVVELMSNDTSFNLKLSGYTDNTGNPDSNLELSKRRANAVKNYLVQKGISGDRLSADGFGIANPVADNNTREGRAANRRVELEIVYN